MRRVHGIVTDRWKYVWFQTTGEELFDGVADPSECADRSDEVPLTPFRERLAAHLAWRDDVVPGIFTPCGNRPPRAIWG